MEQKDIYFLINKKKRIFFLLRFPLFSLQKTFLTLPIRSINYFSNLAVESVSSMRNRFARMKKLSSIRHLEKNHLLPTRCEEEGRGKVKQ